MPLFVTVTPGVVVGNSTSLDAVTLNLLGTPVVDISGTVDGDSSLTVGAGSVTNAMLANMTGPSVKGKRTGTGAPEDIAVDNSTLEIASGPILQAKDLGITTAKLAASGVTYAKIQNVSATSRLLGRSTAGAGVIEELSLGAGLTLSGGVLNTAVSSNVIASFLDKWNYNHSFTASSVATAINKTSGTPFTKTYAFATVGNRAYFEVSIPVTLTNGAMVYLAVIEGASTVVAVGSGYAQALDTVVVVLSGYFTSTSSSHTFKLWLGCGGGSQAVVLNYNPAASWFNNDGSSTTNAQSTFRLTEIS